MPKSADIAKTPPKLHRKQMKSQIYFNIFHLTLLLHFLKQYLICGKNQFRWISPSTATISEEVLQKCIFFRITVLQMLAGRKYINNEINTTSHKLVSTELLWIKRQSSIGQKSRLCWHIYFSVNEDCLVLMHLWLARVSKDQCKFIWKE